MMKRVNLGSVLSAFLVLVLCFSSCSKKEAYTQVIPADASLVVSVNLKSMSEKSGLTEKSSEQTWKKITDALKSGLNAESLKHIEKILKTPSESGLSLSDKVYFFITNNQHLPSMVVKVDDANKLKQTFDIIRKEGVCDALTQADGYSWTILANQGVCAFNENVLLVIPAEASLQQEEAKKSASVLMNQKAEQSISGNKAFQKIAEDKKDIGCLSAMSSLSGIYPSELSNGIDLAQLIIVSSLNFEAGKIVLESEFYTANKEIEKILKEQHKLYGELNSTFLNCFPESSLIYLSTNLNGKAFYQFLAQNKEFLTMINSKPNSDLEQILSLFNGDISIGLTALSDQGVPSIAIYFQMKEENALKTLVASKEQWGVGDDLQINARGENNYEMEIQGMTFYLGMQKKKLCLTNDVARLKDIGQAVENSIASSDYASVAKNSSVFALVNIEAILQQPIISLFFAMAGEQGQIFERVLSECTYMEVTSSSDGITKTNVYLRNRNENVLKQIASGIEQFARTY